MIHSFLRTVGIIDFQALTLSLYIVAHSLQTVGSHPRQQCRRLQITVNAASYEIISAEIAYLKDGIGHDIG